MNAVCEPPAVNSVWLNVAAQPALRAHEPHVWRAWLDLAEPRLAALHETLSADERARAARFHDERDCNHFIAARGLLRELLGYYLERAPACVRFAYGARGKPFLAGLEAARARMSSDARWEKTPLDEELRFNISHSYGLGLFAFARGAEIGVDVEQVRPEVASAEIAERFFSPHELAAQHTLPNAQRAEGFFNCWTRKEAYLKARGNGLSIPLGSFDVTLAPGEPARLLEVRAEHAHRPSDHGDAAQQPDALEPIDQVTRWSMHALTPVPGYAAALVSEGRASAPRLFVLG
jgi:4'-phosphopantetheinyl transferase